MNKIKLLRCIFGLLLGVFMVFLLEGCSKDDATITPEVTISKTVFNFPNTGGTETLSIQTNIPLILESDDETWCTVSNVDITSTKIVQYNIITSANNLSENRQTKITVSGDGFNAEIQINQTSADIIEITNDEKKYSCSKDGGEFLVTLITNGEYDYSIGSSWVSEVEKNDTSVQFSVLANLGFTRSTTITFTCGNSSAEFVVIQEAGDNTIGGEDAMAIAKSLGLGWNLGNQLDAYSNGIANETAWGNGATTQDAFYKIAASGIRTIRIPVTWLGQLGVAPNYTINSAWLNRVAEVVNYAEIAGLNAIINIHHDGADSHHWLNIKDAALSEPVNNEVKAQLRAVWTQIAEKFNDKGNFLIFESMNEIHDGGWGWGANLSDGGKQYAVLNEWNQVFVDAVRLVGGENSNRYLGVPGYVTNPELTIDHFILPNDNISNRLLVAVHFYDPSEYAINDKYSEWGHTAASDQKDSYGDEADMKELFGKLKTKFVDNGIPVYIGEMGSVHRNTDRAESFRKYYLEYLCKAARTYGLAPFYWDNGSPGTGKECFGLLNHANGKYINNGKDIIDIMVKAVSNDDSSYTLDSVYDSAP